MSAPTLPFKLESIEKLKGQSNYTRWASLVIRVLKINDYDELALVKQELPTDAALLKAHNKKEMIAIMTIQLTIDQDQQFVIEGCSTTFDAWTALQNTFDRRNVASSFHTFRDILNLHMSDSESMTDYLLRFGNSWSQAHSRASTGSDELALAIKPFLVSDPIKSAILLNSLPDSYNDTVNILQSKANQTFEDHITHLRNLKTADDNAKALFNKPKGKGQAPTSRKPTSQPRSGKTTDLECTWCKSKGQPFKGHLHNTCFKLKKHQEDRKKGVAAVAAEPVTSTALVTTSSSSGVA